MEGVDYHYSLLRLRIIEGHELFCGETLATRVNCCNTETVYLVGLKSEPELRALDTAPIVISPFAYAGVYII